MAWLCGVLGACNWQDTYHKQYHVTSRYISQTFAWFFHLSIFFSATYSRSLGIAHCHSSQPQWLPTEGQWICRTVHARVQLIRIGYCLRWRSDIWRMDRGVSEVRSPGIRPATEDDIRHNAPGLVEKTHLKTLVFRFWVTQKITKPRQAVTLRGETKTRPSFSEPTDCMWKPFFFHRKKN